MTSIEGTYAGAMPKSIQGIVDLGNGNGNSVNNYNDFFQDIYRYQKLNEYIVIELNEYFNLFSNGDYYSLKEKYIKSHNRLSLILGDRTNFYNTDIDNLTILDINYQPGVFENYRSLSIGLLNGMDGAINQFDQVRSLQKDVYYYQDILRSEQNIIKYLNEHKEISQLAFSSKENLMVKCKLKPWYHMYLEIHGPPNDGIFKNELMAEIVLDLIKKGDITEEQFINDSYIVV